MINKKAIAQSALLLAAVLMIGLGIWRGEADTVLAKAIRLCMECVGIGLEKQFFSGPFPGLVSSRRSAADEHSPAEFCQGCSVSGQGQNSMCAGAELLLLPGCGGGLPDRLVSGSGRLVKIPIFLLYYRHPDFIGGAAGTVYLRLSLPVWLAAGAFA